MTAPDCIRRGILASTIVLAVAACSPATESDATPPGAQPAGSGESDAPSTQRAGSVTIDDAAVSAFLASTYGPAASLSGEWNNVPTDASFSVEDESDGQVARSVCEREKATVSGQPAVLLAVCGTVRDAGHPTAGTNDFFLLQPRDGALAPTASAHIDEFGSRGEPGDVDGERFGADLYGFVVESGFYNMGQGVQTAHLLLPKDGGFVDAGWFREALDNGDWMKGCLERGQCSADEAYDIDFELEIDDSDPGAAAYPLRITESGTACGKPADATHDLALDTATMTYAVPAALQRDGCGQAAGE